MSQTNFRKFSPCHKLIVLLDFVIIAWDTDTDVSSNNKQWKFNLNRFELLNTNIYSRKTQCYVHIFSIWKFFWTRLVDSIWINHKITRERNKMINLNKKNINECQFRVTCSWSEWKYIYLRRARAEFRVENEENKKMLRKFAQTLRTREIKNLFAIFIANDAFYNCVRAQYNIKCSHSTQWVYVGCNGL